MQAQPSSYSAQASVAPESQPPFTSSRDTQPGPTSIYHLVIGAYTDGFGYFPTSKSEERTSLEQSAALIDPITQKLLQAPYMSNCGCGSTLDLSTWKKLEEKGSKCVICGNVFTRRIYNTRLAEELSLPGSQRPFADRLEEFFKRRPIETAHQMQIAKEAIGNLHSFSVMNPDPKSLRETAFTALQAAYELSPTSAKDCQALSQQLFPIPREKKTVEEEECSEEKESSNCCGSKRKAEVFSEKEKDLGTHKKSRKGKEKEKEKEVENDQAACVTKVAEERTAQSFPEILLHEHDIFSKLDDHFSGLPSAQVHCNKLVNILENIIDSYEFPRDFKATVKKPLTLLPQYGEFLSFELIRDIISQINEGYMIFKSKYFYNRGM